jgi:hypothetical protein
MLARLRGEVSVLPSDFQSFFNITLLFLGCQDATYLTAHETLLKEWVDLLVRKETLQEQWKQRVLALDITPDESRLVNDEHYRKTHSLFMQWSGRKADDPVMLMCAVDDIYNADVGRFPVFTRVIRQELNRRMGERADEEYAQWLQEQFDLNN